MEYFILTQDSRLTLPQLPSEMLQAFPSQVMRHNKPLQLSETLSFTIHNKQEVEYPSVLTRPVFCLVDHIVKGVFSRYNRKLNFMPIMLNDPERKEQHLYWMVEVPTVDCLAPETELYPNKSFKKAVLDQAKIARKPIFKIGGIVAEYLVVRLDVAESLLRRDTVYGIDLTPIATNERKA